MEDKHSGHPRPFIIEPSSKHTHTHTAILLHGLGSNGEKFGAELLQSGLSSTGATFAQVFPGMKFIFPTAKFRRASAFKRAMVTQWFDVFSMEDRGLRRDLQIDGLVESAGYIRSILREEVDIIGPGNVVLGGLSRGCAMSLFVLLSLEFPIGGFVGMSGWLPFGKDITEVSSARESVEDDFISFGEDDEGEVENDDPFIRAVNLVRDILSLGDIDAFKEDHGRSCFSTPVFLGHGDLDEKVKFELGEEAAGIISSLGMNTTWKAYPGLGHWYKIPDEIDDIVAFLRQSLGG
ncbi:hypothetical protein FQN54_006303 [Arachnomyces sp. PD_36]|nr:hypothetical protein FQN54_006303 [Arachnomyces sp. PD_36]